jgi:hypothetical protein
MGNDDDVNKKIQSDFEADEQSSVALTLLRSPCEADPRFQESLFAQENDHTSLQVSVVHPIF